MRAILLLSVLALAGCTPDAKLDSGSSEGIPGGIWTTTVNGHAYIIWRNYGYQSESGTLLHDAACPNPAHKCPCDTIKP